MAVPLEGLLVALREERRADQRMVAQLRNHRETQAWGKALPPTYPKEMHSKRFDAMEFSYDRTSARPPIVQNETGELAGCISHTDLEPWLSACIGLVVANRSGAPRPPSMPRRSFSRLLFAERGLRVVHLWTHRGSPRAAGLAEKPGSRVTARLREAAYKNGRLLDTLSMSLTRDEDYARHPELADALPDPAELLCPDAAA